MLLDGVLALFPLSQTFRLVISATFRVKWHSFETWNLIGRLKKLS